jgi:hypothetical protein
MFKNNKKTPDPEYESCQENSENFIQNLKYIKKLELQRSVLKMLLEEPDSETNAINKVIPHNQIPE